MADKISEMEARQAKIRGPRYSSRGPYEGETHATPGSAAFGYRAGARKAAIKAGEEKGDLRIKTKTAQIGRHRTRERKIQDYAD